MFRTWKLAREITITLSEREDGGIRIRSDDVPGLILSGSDKDKVLADLGPALAALIMFNGNIELREDHPAASATPAPVPAAADEAMLREIVDRAEDDRRHNRLTHFTTAKSYSRDDWFKIAWSAYTDRVALLSLTQSQAARLTSQSAALEEARKALEDIRTMQPEPIADSGFSTRQKLLFDACQRRARAALSSMKGGG